MEDTKEEAAVWGDREKGETGLSFSTANPTPKETKFIVLRETQRQPPAAPSPLPSLKDSLCKDELSLPPVPLCPMKGDPPAPGQQLESSLNRLSPPLTFVLSVQLVHGQCSFPKVSNVPHRPQVLILITWCHSPLAALSQPFFLLVALLAVLSLRPGHWGRK